MTDTSTPRCENCKYFFDSYPCIGYGGEVFGLCNVELPPWVVLDGDERRVNAKYVCALHKPKEVKP